MPGDATEGEWGEQEWPIVCPHRGERPSQGQLCRTKKRGGMEESPTCFQICISLIV